MIPLVRTAPLLGIAAARVVDTSDCERVGGTFPHQPAAAWSSLAFVLVGVWIVARYGREPATGAWRRFPVLAGCWAAVAGLGSVAYHGIGSDAGRWVHDAGFLLVLLFVAMWDWLPVGRWSPTRTRALGGATLALAVGAAIPSLTNVALGVLSIVIGVAELRAWPARAPRERTRLRRAGAVLAVALVVYLLSRTGGPTCDPDAILQGHAVWHVLTAVVLGMWAQVAFEPAAPAGSGEAVQDVVGDAGGGVGER